MKLLLAINMAALMAFAGLNYGLGALAAVTIICLIITIAVEEA